ncbi:uncharacterized protein E0L32_006320 [Thyridium curvatum]|uniref:SET domain-containing protein n=1 Tax=Thyridium curvatum TaxID=1093900 RepID=A0A507B0U2_9PEZI|nr:uncharacterized protein E0L32_006320 [Thyridium curvatum]TPX13347.1 hypothetical protein E0L32_006320 [Thyridium curvatum]
MGVDVGFDMVPRLSNGIVDRHNWDRFINFIKECYKDDDQVEIKPNYFLFKVGEHPMLPFEGHKFLRFSSKITWNIGSYIDRVTSIARAHFGSRVRVWDESAYQSGHYDWHEVHESLRSYEQTDEAEIHDSTDPRKELGLPLFEIKDIPGKGKGLIALSNIPQGTRILCEKPILTAGPMPPDALDRVLAGKLKALSKVEQRQFLSLHNNHPGKYPFRGIFKTNALPCGPGSSVGGVYPMSCFINHSCLPNSHNNWNAAAEHETTHAIRPIKIGEEVTISYDRGGPSTVRQDFLKKAFGFHCNCSGCTLPPSELQASDTRRLLIQDLDNSIGDLDRMATSPEKSLEDCRLLLQALKDEFNGYAGASIARFYYDAFQISIAHGDQARASVFAERAYEARVICEGEDSPSTQRAHSLALRPPDHFSFGLYSMKWKTTREDIPKALTTAQFEKWLFREQS